MTGVKMIRLSFFIPFFEIIHRIHIVIHSVTSVIFSIDCAVRCDVIPAITIFMLQMPFLPQPPQRVLANSPRSNQQINSQ